MEPTVVSQPDNMPLDLLELKKHLNLDGTDRFDEYLTILIKATVTPAQRAVGQQFITATLRWKIRGWKQVVEMPRPPLQSVESVEYRDETGTWQTVATSNYDTDTETKPGYVRFVNDYEVPDTYENEIYPWRFTYKAGYANSDGRSTYQQVPAELRLWMMNLIGTKFMKREADMIANGSVDIKTLHTQMARLVRGHQMNRRFG